MALPEQTLTAEQWLPASIWEVFRFHADARNLERITPPFLGFRILSMTTPNIGEGTVIDYRLRLHGLPLRWRSRIEVWRPPYGFIDRQLSGPYALWHHTHEFEEREGGTTMRDRVRYRLPGGSAAALLLPLVQRDLAAIFSYRRAALESLLAGARGSG